MKTYIYHCVCSGEYLLRNGFSQFENNIYAMRIIPDSNSKIVKNFNTLINSKSFQEFLNKTGEELTESEWQLCVSLSENDKDKKLFFINAPDGNYYYNDNIVNETCGNIITALLKKGIAKRKRYNG